MKITYREAIRRGLHDALAADPRVFLMGEDVGKYGGSYAVSKGFLDEFGPERIRDTPLSELAFVGAGIGAALGGMRPIVEVMTVNFSLLALDQIVNTAALYRHMSGGQFSVPVVIRMATGAGRQLAAQHSHSLENWYAHVPGITVLSPATIDDARGMLAPALADPDPVVIFEHALLYNFEGELTDAARDVDIRSAKILRAGADVTLIAYGGTVWKALQAAQELVADGVEAEVLDLRVLRPLDDATIMASVRRTRRAVVDRRRLANRQPRRRGDGADHGTGVLRSRRAARPRVQRGGADPVREAPRGRRVAAGVEDRRGGPPDAGERLTCPRAHVRSLPPDGKA